MEHQYGVSPPDDEFKSVGGSEYGSTFHKVEPASAAKGNRSIRSSEISINWSIERVVLTLQLVSMSISNIVSALKIANGAEAGTCKFVRPSEDDDFEKPWSYGTGVTSIETEIVLDAGAIPVTTKMELLEAVGKVKEDEIQCGQ